MSKYLIAIDDGHGMETPGKRTPPIPSLGSIVIRENEFNRAVKRYLDAELKRCGFDTLIVAPGDKDVSLSTRTSLANNKKADAYISIHYNALDGKFNGNDPEGIEIHVYPKSSSGRKLAECILKYLKQGTKQKNRGIKESNFHVLRETKMPAILSENGFMDNKKEALLMVNVDFQKEVAREHAQGICEYFNVKYIPEKELSTNSNNKVLYRVQTGAFASRSNAISLEKKLKKDGFDTYIVQATDKLYKVQVGAYSIRKNADAMAKKLKEKGYSTFVTTKSGKAVIYSSTDVKTQKAIKAGSKVKVRQGAKDYNGKGLAGFVYKQSYDVLQINKDRVVIGKGKSITAAVNKKDLILV